MINQIIRAPAFAPPEKLPEQGQWTYDDWVRLPDDGYRYEILDGVLYMAPPPSIDEHQTPAFNLTLAFGNFITQRDAGRLFFAPAGVRLPGQPVPVQPDIFFVAQARRHIIRQQYCEGAPDLVIEILSPSNWNYDRRDKFEAYQAAGVREYWIVDPRARTVEVYVLEDGLYLLTGKWGAGERAKSQVLNEFEIAVDDIFRK
jgi:Uma2 family endonuclease